MIWLKSALTGFVAAIATIVAIVLATTTFYLDAGREGGGVGAVYLSLSALLLFPAGLAFAMGFRWMYRRQRRRFAQ